MPGNPTHPLYHHMMAAEDRYHRTLFNHYGNGHFYEVARYRTPFRQLPRAVREASLAMQVTTWAYLRACEWLRNEGM